MSDVKSKGTLIRTIGAGLAGILTAVLPAIASDVLMRKLGIFTASGTPMAEPLFLLATAYRTVYSIAGSYVAARLAPSHPMRLALILGWIGLAVSAMGVIATWNQGPEFGPKWYPISLVVLALPSAWVGGKLAVRRSS